jgi:uncharacterized protein (TIGR00299 family) protein
MRVAVFDAFSGVAGDMWVGALLDAGVPLAPLQAAVRSLQLPGVSVRAEKVLRAGLAGTRFCVDVPGGADSPIAFAPLAAAKLSAQAQPGHVHRRLGDIERIVQRAELPPAVVADALAVYRAIGEVEAKAHGVGLDEVHFHEVGAEDTIVDVVCACLGTSLLQVDEVHCHGLALGSGTVKAEHGLLPVPAPATAALLRGIPARIGGPRGERTTPTGAALLRVLCDRFDAPLTFTSEAIGYGAGTRDDAELPNLLRVTVGVAAAATSATELCELQCHVDTATGEQVGWLLDELLARGAVDAFATAVTMKKGRTGVLLTALCDDARARPLESFLLEEAGTLGVRRHRVQRSVLERWQETRATPFGAVAFKCARLPSGALVARPEDDELRRVCREHGIGRAEALRRLLGG